MARGGMTRDEKSGQAVKMQGKKAERLKGSKNTKRRKRAGYILLEAKKHNGWKLKQVSTSPSLFN
jgi:hypothetical protein